MAGISFGGALDFGAASYGAGASLEAGNDSAPHDAKLTASIASGGGVLTLQALRVGTISLVGPPPLHKVFTQTGSSDGKKPLTWRKGDAARAQVALAVPMAGVTPGDVAAILHIHVDAGGPPVDVPLRVTLIGVDEASPIGEKWLALGGLAFSGAPLANAELMPDHIGALQVFERGVIVHSPDFGAAWLSAAIFAKLNSDSLSAPRPPVGQAGRDYLGYPVGDGFATFEPGGEAAIFERGMIVVRANGAAFAVLGDLYRRYAAMGGVAAGAPSTPFIGLPISDEEPAANGLRSRFEGADIYWKAGVGTFEVHGAIREAWLRLGGAAGFLGFPASDETAVMGGGREIGRSNRFEGGATYWSAATGAFECHGDIGALYAAGGGPAGALGFPTSNEADTPGGGRFNAFQNGFIVWHAMGPLAGARTVGSSITLELAEFQDSRHDDFNVQVHLDDSRGQSIHVRMPAGGNYCNGNQQFNPPASLIGVAALDAGYSLDVWMLCIHENTIGSDDEDGTVTAHYDIDNLWGTADAPTHRDGGFGVEMKAIPQPQVFPTGPGQFRTALFWPFHNFSTEAMTWTQFSKTFVNVGEGDLGFNLLPWNWHLWERAFFQIVYRGIASGGNCFGMALESHYAREARTLFVEPIYDSPDNAYNADTKGAKPDPANPNDVDVIDAVNIKMGYQLGADFINWFIAMEALRDTQDAVLAFRDSRDAFARGDWPTIMLAPSSLSQDGHVVAPYQWLVSFDGAPPVEASEAAIASQPLPSQAWILRVANPNYPPASFGDDNAGNEIRIQPFANTWTFTGASGNWSGSKGADGRIFCAPFNLLSFEPSMVGDFIIGLLQGLMVVIFSGDGQTRQIRDERGRTYFAAGGRASGRIVNPDPLTRVPDMAYVPGYRAQFSPRDAVGAPPHEIYSLRRPVEGFRWPGREAPSPAILSHSQTATRRGLFDPRRRSSLLLYEIDGGTGAGYRWNVSCPRMSADIQCAGGGTDAIGVANAGGAHQTVSITPDPRGAARQFTVAVGGWRGADRAARKIYILSDLALHPGAAVSLGVSDGGRELWIESAGAAARCKLEIFIPGRDRALATAAKFELRHERIMRIRPSHWDVGGPDAELRISVYSSDHDDDRDPDDDRRRDDDDERERRKGR